MYRKYIIILLGGNPECVLSSHGEIRYKKIDSSVRTLILASDGLWDALSPEEIVKVLDLSALKK